MINKKTGPEAVDVNPEKSENMSDWLACCMFSTPCCFFFRWGFPQPEFAERSTCLKYCRNAFCALENVCHSHLQELEDHPISWEPKGTPRMPPPRRNKALIRPSFGKPMVNSPLIIRPYSLGGWHCGGFP